MIGVCVATSLVALVLSPWLIFAPHHGWFLFLFFFLGPMFVIWCVVGTAKDVADVAASYRQLSLNSMRSKYNSKGAGGASTPSQNAIPLATPSSPSFGAFPSAFQTTASGSSTPTPNFPTPSLDDEEKQIADALTAAIDLLRASGDLVAMHADTIVRCANGHSYRMGAVATTPASSVARPKQSEPRPEIRCPACGIDVISADASALSDYQLCAFSTRRYDHAVFSAAPPLHAFRRSLGRCPLCRDMESAEATLRDLFVRRFSPSPP
ncbi:MAG: hypothetical protein KIS66_00510 [Fimbriimonadaceae bacterium]|nr:hypothetical protein [Fimbriimonadaceae bacterium]